MSARRTGSNSRLTTSAGFWGRFRPRGRDLQEAAAYRLIGTEGMIEVRGGCTPCAPDKWNDERWQTIEQPDDLHGPGGGRGLDGVERAIANMVDSLATGRESMLSAWNALRSTEVIFAAYESSRRRGCVDLPLTPDDNAFVSMFAQGEIGPGAASE